MLPKSEHDSDEDEGFLPTKIQIRKQIQKIKQPPSRPLDFEPRYLNGTVTLKKQPTAIYQRFQHYIPSPIDQHSSFIEQKQYSLRYEQYFTNKAYKLVYSRFAPRETTKDNKKKQEKMSIFANNQIKLTHALNQYQPQRYSVLRKNEREFMASQANQAISSLLRSVTMGHAQEQHENNNDLIFDSQFEGGNLMHAFRYINSSNTYVLFMQNDTNTIGYNQWFYFTLRNAKPGIPYRFHILNFRKRNLLFKEKLRISVFSLVDALNKKNKKTGWRKMGDNIKFERSPMKIDGSKESHFTKNTKYYCLSFSLKFQNANDYISVAMNPPYTYSRLINSLNTCKKALENGGNLKWSMRPIAYSLANNAVPYITIQRNQEHEKKDHKIPQQPKYVPEMHSIDLLKSLEKLKKSRIESQTHHDNGHDNEKEEQKCSHQYEEEPVEKKKLIIFLARQHPGQTWSSFLMEEILHFISHNTSDKQIQFLFSQYVIKVFPMINVDGVIYGNFRCDLAGFDLNRTWKQPHRDLHPQVYAIKKQIQKLNEQYTIQCVFDLHGHSKQYNVFCYSCELNPIAARVLPKMFHNKNKLFHFPFCTFGLSKYKESTARAVIHKLVNIDNVLTIENSFYGMKIDEQYHQFEPGMLKNMAQTIIRTLTEYLYEGESRQQAQKEIKKNLKAYLQMQEKLNNDSGSDSDPYQDEIPFKEKAQKVLPKNISIDRYEKDEMPKKVKRRPKNLKKESLTIQKKSESEMKIPKLQEKIFGEEINTKKLVNVGNKSVIKREKNSVQLLKALGNQLYKFEKQYESAKRVDATSKAFLSEPQGKISHHFSSPHEQKPKILPVNIRRDSIELFKNAYMNSNERMEDQIERNYKKGIILSWNRNKQSDMHYIGTPKNEMEITNTKHLQKEKQKQKKEQLPMLCIFSDRKRRQAEKLRQEERSQKNLTNKFKQFERNNKVDRLRRMQKQKRRHKEWGNTSTGWKQMYSHLGLNVFFGDMP